MSNKNFPNKKNSKKFTSKKKTNGVNHKSNPKYEAPEQEKGFVPNPHNDVSWYSNNPQLLKDCASLPFSNMLGQEVELSGLGYSDSEYRVPGIMVLGLEPTIGTGRTATDPATVAARNIYSFIRHANSGSANYEAPDLYMMLCARASAEAWLEALKRVYGCIMHFSVRNRYYAKAIVESFGFKYDYWVSHINDLRAYINLTAAKLNTVKIPSNFALLERWKWINSGLVVDSDNAKPQTYVTKFNRYLKWSGYSSETGTELQLTAPGYIDDMVQVTEFTDELLNPLYFEEDVGIMSGDIIKAYGSNVSETVGIDENYVIIPSMDDNIRYQIHNATMPIPSDAELSEHTIRQDNGVIVENIAVVRSYDQNPDLHDWLANDAGRFSRAAAGTYLLDMYHDNVTPEEVMVATRLTGGKFDNLIPGDDSITMSLYGTGTEFVTSIGICNDPNTGAVNGLDTCILSTAQGIGSSELKSIVDMSCFDWHPIIYVAAARSGDEGVIADLSNYCVVSADVLTRLNAIAVLSELNITANTSIK